MEEIGRECCGGSWHYLMKNAIMSGREKDIMKPENKQNIFSKERWGEDEDPDRLKNSAKEDAMQQYAPVFGNNVNIIKR